ncbi:MAG TPA: universal stress protein, partial [Herpetosiphonaceae bacterium]
WEQARADAQTYLDSAAARLAACGVAATTRVLEGDPASALLSYARANKDIAMIAMATHGRSGVRHLLFGSVAEKILHAAPVPLLLARAQQETVLTGIGPYRSLLVPLDGSLHAEQALPLAHRLARRTAADLILMHAVPTPDDLTLAQHGYSAGWDDRHLAKLRSRAEAYLQTKAARHAAGGAPVRTLVRTGHAGEQIVAAAREASADLVVMATHGLTGLRRLWLGSMATYVVRHSLQPVLLVRSEPDADEAEQADRAGALAGSGAAR